MNNKSKKQKQTWISPTETFIKNIDEIVQSGISREDRDFLLAELDEMAQMLEEWKKNNPELPSVRKAS